MNKKINLYKLHVNKVLMNYPKDVVDIYILCEGKNENLELVFKYLLELSESMYSKSNNYILKVLSGLTSYIKLYNEKSRIINKDDINKLEEIEEKYQKFLTDNQKDADKSIIKHIEQLKNALKENNSQFEETIPMEEIIEKADELNIRIKQVESLNQQLKVYEERIKKLKEKDERTENIKKDLYRIIKDLKLEVKNLTSDNEELTKKVTIMEEELNNKNNLNTNQQKKIDESEQLIKNLKMSIAVYESQLNDVNKQLRKYEEIENQKEQIKLKEQNIDDYILLKLLEKPYTFYQLYNEIKKDGYNITQEDINLSLKRIKKTINITDPYKRTLPPKFKTCPPTISTNTSFEINNKQNCINLIITSDWHLSIDLDFKKLLEKLDILYNYCIINNINTIINVGDYLDIKHDTPQNQYRDNKLLIENIINYFPKDKNIRNGILGGNHDKRMLELGIDPLEMISEYRHDYINLGYDNAQIIFNNNDKKSDILGIYHPDIFGLDLSNNKIIQSYILNYLKQYYKNNHINKKDIYLNLFGHFHFSVIDYYNSYCLVPSYLKSNNYGTNEFLHLKIYFTDENKIDLIEIKSLLNDKNLTPINECIYQKKK